MTVQSRALACLAMLVTTRVMSFEQWRIVEVYSNADGGVQFIELATDSDDQQELRGQTLTASSDGSQITFTFPADTGVPTAGRRLLLATPGFGGVEGSVTQDAVLPAVPFFDPAALQISLDFAGQDLLLFSGADIPVDGVFSLDRDLISRINSPTNFAGETGRIPEVAVFASGFESPPVTAVQAP
ncbi:MAG: hypothetical protein QNJ40_11900 [Xanthomonadales bacterium]|nr:hypothetical protein [Xanthomonadales bacterium]